ncbi:MULTISPECIES: fibronectin type III domain-containing protein [Sphingobacterium]|uniref:fibronectin type III domain-containing protein n=1 Tax=Sphingobacterium TaxID=28453 RepID=UPI0022439053|nr:MULTISPECIES: fibronectin type III domain-containing protein [Sphingobacterium]MCW8310294.1 fibronectin type III domain-containing protein [Sphingobacterium sp. InxBP1]
MSQLTINERGQTDVQLMQTAEQIATKMANETTLFPDPVPALSVLNTALAAFRNSATEAAYRDTRAIMIRKQKRQELVYILKELGKYVDTIANNDDTIVLAAGFNIRKTNASYDGFVPRAQRPIAEPGQIGSGRIVLKTVAWTGARMYEYQFRLKGSNAEWSSQLCSKSSCIIEGLETFKEYEFRVTYIGINPTPNYSDLTSSFVL